MTRTARSPRSRVAKRRDRPRRRSAAMIGAAVGAVVVIVVLFLGPGTIGIWMNQRSQTAELHDKISTIDKANAALAEQKRQLNDPKTVAYLARRNYGMVPKGSKSYAILPQPQASVVLTDTWPFVELSHTSAGAATTSTHGPATTTP